MLELVDRHDSGSCVRKGVEVQVLSRAFFCGELLGVSGFFQIRGKGGLSVQPHERVESMKVLMRSVLRDQRVESKVGQRLMPAAVRRLPVLSLIAAAALVACTTAGCERKTYTYAGVEAQGTPAPTPNPHR